MNIEAIKNKILNEIPILKSMGIDVLELTESSSTLKVPLAQNHNHKGTAFGGSLYAAATAACYALLYNLQFKQNILNRDLVIAKGEIKYLKPVDQDFFVNVSIDPEEFKKVTQSFALEKPKRITVSCQIKTIICGPTLCEFIGEFAFLKK